MTLFSDPEYLRKCEHLQTILKRFSFEEGEKIARGFADLGYEEFVVLPGSRLLSLYSGKTSELPDDHRKFFFWVPGSHELSQEVMKLADIEKIDLIEQRTWRVKLKSAAKSAEYVAEGASLDLALLNAYLQLLE